MQHATNLTPGINGDGISGERGWKRSTFCANGGCVEVRVGPGSISVRDSKQADGPVLVYTPEEWRDFVQGVKAGEFEPTAR